MDSMTPGTMAPAAAAAPSRPTPLRRGRFGLFLRSLVAMRDPLRLAELDLPWWSFGAAEWADGFLHAREGEATVFEFGPGASTVWLARRCRQVTFVEHDPRWWPTMQALTAGLPQVRGRLVEAGLMDGPAGDGGGPACQSGRLGHRGLDYTAYVAAIREAGGPFDLIVIDGRARVACLHEAIRHLKPDGAILFDNSDRSRYQAALADCGLDITRLSGLTPAAPYPTETAVLRHRHQG
jgi:hypothetical protein